MDNIVEMQKLQSDQNAGNKKLSLRLSEPAPDPHVVA